MWAKSPRTLDTNVAFYAFSDDPLKAPAARLVLERAAFVSVQLVNEFVNALRRKQNRSWDELTAASARLRRSVPQVLPFDEAAHLEALRLVARYKLGFYDAAMLGVAISAGARTFYSEDMQHGMEIDGTLRIVNPFIPGALDT